MKGIIKFIIIIILLLNIFNIANSEKDNINSIIQNNHNKLLKNNNDDDNYVIKKEEEEKGKSSEELLLDDFKITRGKTPNGETIDFDDSEDASNYQENGCKIIETCRKCLESEKNEPYCSTNHRIKMFCEDNESIRFISCKILNNKKTKNNNNYNNKNHNIDGINNNNNNNNPKIEKTSAINIIYFEVVVLVVFVFSIYFVKERKRISSLQNNERLAKQLNKV
ncbi:hypothetical protein ACTFIR_007231 [Dictyostelium discoideum]